MHYRNAKLLYFAVNLTGINCSVGMEMAYCTLTTVCWLIWSYYCERHGLLKRTHTHPSEHGC